MPAAAFAQDAGDAARGKTLFTQSCAVCHSDVLGPGNTVIIRQGPNLVGVVGRRAGTGMSFNYTKPLRDSGLTWDAATLSHFLTNPAAAVPGTAMPIPVPNDQNRADLIAYLSTLKLPAGVTVVAAATPAPSGSPGEDPGDWHHAAPGVKHHVTVADLPPPYATRSAGNGPKVVPKPADAALSVPQGFAVKPFATGFNNPRLVRVAPNGDIFVAETAANRIHVLRAADGAESPAENKVFATDLDRPFGIAFYPPGPDPQWIYIANINSVVRIPYHTGDLAASGAPQVIVPRLAEGQGGHSTRDVIFSQDGKRMFIAIGSASNDAETMPKKSAAEIQAWETAHSLGAAWDAETNRADVLVTDPEGKAPLRTFATGIRNGVTIAVNPKTGDLWTSTNERDGLGDDLVPDYVTRVKEGGFYGWPWFYMGNIEDPRHSGERPDLMGKIIVPDVLLQSHSAPLQMTFYTAEKGAAAFPAEYLGDAFVACHGSWNRSHRTGYKIIRVRIKDGVPTGEYDDFLTGFVVNETEVWGRPVGVAVARDGALLVSDDGSGTVWRVAPVGK
ncbi:MAG TPA: PQQ-dependent sugar dehydrogenase [Chthoniobacteraceae bacterium]|nr:PQQ-dependent sugar dehydrogenase [Chthoniobacteraceae bacterium]